jgi:hypothetical protein
MQTAAEISAELTLLYAARTALATGTKVAEVWRDGRRITYTETSLNDLNTYIAQREADLEQAQAVEAGRPRRRAIGTYF